jgi:hypothetical protein
MITSAGEHIMAEHVTTWHRQAWFEGWRLFAVLTLTLMALCVWITGMRQFEVEGIRMSASPREPRCSSSVWRLAPPRSPSFGRPFGRDGSAATAVISA